MEGAPEEGGRGAGWGAMGLQRSVGVAPLPDESHPPQAHSAGWWGCGLPAPGPQSAQHRVQRLERGLLLQPVALPGHQPELEPLQQLGHDHLHLHLCAEVRTGRRPGHERAAEPAAGWPIPPPPPAQGSQSRAQKCLLARDETPALKPASGRNPRPGLLPEQTAARCRSAVPERRGSR